MIELLDGCLIEPPRFKPMARFEKFGCQRVFYKGSAPQQKETEQERALAEVANEQWQRYKQVGVPAREQFFKRVDDSGTEAANTFARGTAASATAAKYGDAGLRTVKPAGQFGLAMARAKNATDNTIGASLSQEDTHAGGLQNIVAMGQGQATQATAGLSDLAQAAQQKATVDVTNQYNNRAANAGLAGMVVGGVGQASLGSAAKKNAWFEKSNEESGFGASLGKRDPFDTGNFVR